MPRPGRVPIQANTSPENAEDLDQLVEQYFQENQLDEVDYNACYEENEENQENEEFQQFYEEMDDIIDYPMKSPEKFRFPVCKPPQPASTVKPKATTTSRPKQEAPSRKPLQVRNGTVNKEASKKVPAKALKQNFTAAPSTQKVLLNMKFLNTSESASSKKTKGF